MVAENIKMDCRVWKCEMNWTGS